MLEHQSALYRVLHAETRSILRLIRFIVPLFPSRGLLFHSEGQNVFSEEVFAVVALYFRVLFKTDSTAPDINHLVF